MPTSDPAELTTEELARRLYWAAENGALLDGDWQTLRAAAVRIESLSRQVETLREAARDHVTTGHNDTCSTVLLPGRNFACDCGHDKAREALRAGGDERNGDADK